MKSKEPEVDIKAQIGEQKMSIDFLKKSSLDF